MFIVFEGLDGSGKTFLSKSVVTKLQESVGDDYKVHYTCEPTDSFYGKMIKTGKIKSKEQLVEYFIKDRRCHIIDVILPILSDKSNILICDRYYYSTLAYQGLEYIDDVKRDIIEPDLVFFVDCPPHICIERINQRKHINPQFEDITILLQAYENYLKLFSKQDEKVHIIDNYTRSTDENITKIVEVIRGKNYDKK